MRRVTLIKGDGIGPEITDAVIKIINAAGVAIDWDIQTAGADVIEAEGTPLPPRVLESVKQNKVALKSPVTTPIGKGFRSVNVQLRKELDLYANLRPCYNLPNVKTRYDKVDIVVVRENTEDLYAGIERQVDKDTAESIKIITRAASERIAKFAFDYAVNNNRITQLGEVIQVMKRTQDALDSGQVLSVIEKYSTALDLLDAYDHQNMERPKGNEAAYILTYEECKEIISSMRFGNESDIFGKEKDDSFKGSIGNIYQSFGGEDLYPTLEEKAAHLLYFITKNHSFHDGNKRIAATIFLYFLDRNGALFVDGNKTIDDHTLVALTIMIAESKPEEMEMMITVIMNCMK